MDTEITKKNLYSTLGEIVRDNYYADEMDFTRINNEVEELMRNAEACEYLINNRRKLNDEEFYLVLSSFLDLYFNEFDYYHILELVNGKKYVGIFNMPTTMAVSIDLTERTKDTFKFWNQDMQIYYKVLYTKEFKRDAYHIYTKKDIAELVRDKQICLLSMSYNEIIEDFKKEKYSEFDVAFDYNNDAEFINKDGKFYPYTLKYVRNAFTSRKLRKILLEYLQHINSEIKDVTRIDDTAYYCNDEERFINEYNKEFQNEGFEYRLHQLNQNFLSK